MRREDIAVSPVIGVLLMLTLTLIIAAIVNSYAGGLVVTETKAPSVTLHASYSQSNGLTLRHVSGDPIPTSSVKIIVRPSETMGRNASQSSSVVDKQYIINSSGGTWESGIPSFRPGEVAYVNESTNDGFSYLQQDIAKSENLNYSINNPNNLGNTFIIEIYYKNTIISRSEVLIER